MENRKSYRKDRETQTGLIKRTLNTSFPQSVKEAIFLSICQCLLPTARCFRLGSKVRLIVDGGRSQVGIESTVLDLTTKPPQLLRPGMIHTASLLAVLGGSGLRRAESGTRDKEEVLRSPGQLRKHYSPKARLVMLKWKHDDDLNAQIMAHAMQPSKCHVIAHSHVPSGGGLGGVSVIPHDAEAYARAIYAELHRCDAEGASWILVEALPTGPEWVAIADRLQRAGS